MEPLCDAEHPRLNLYKQDTFRTRKDTFPTPDHLTNILSNWWRRSTFPYNMLVSLSPSQSMGTLPLFQTHTHTQPLARMRSKRRSPVFMFLAKLHSNVSHLWWWLCVDIRCVCLCVCGCVCVCVCVRACVRAGQPVHKEVIMYVCDDVCYGSCGLT